MNKSTEDVFQAKLDAILSGTEKMDLPLIDEGGLPIGTMRPLTERHLKQSEVIEKLTDWRNLNMEKFLTHFTATPERTRGWVQNVLFKVRGQMLYLVYDQKNTLLGHVGFKNFNDHSVLLDNVMRGERGGHPRLFVSAGKALVRWLWDSTAIQRIEGLVLVDNVPAIMMNRQLGFQGWTRHPLIKRTTEDGVQWDMGIEGQLSPDDRYCFRIYIERGTDKLASV